MEGRGDRERGGGEGRRAGREECERGGGARGQTRREETVIPRAVGGMDERARPACTRSREEALKERGTEWKGR